MISSQLNATPVVVPIRSRPSDELLAAVNVIGSAGKSGVDHDVHGERGDVRWPDHAPDGQSGTQLIAALVEVIAEQGGRQRGIDEASGEKVDPDRCHLN